MNVSSTTEERKLVFHTISHPLGSGVQIPGKLSDLRQKLGRKAKQEPKFRFYTLYDRIFRSDTLMTVRHEAAQEMRVGPSEPPYRWRLQTTVSCAGKEPGW